MGFTERERAMNNHDRRRLMALLTGELDDEQTARLRQRLAREPELAAAHRSLQATWERMGGGAEAKGAEAVDFVPRVMSAIRREDAERRASSFRGSPMWVRAVAAVALVAGLGLGALIGDSANLGRAGGTSTPAASAASGETQVAVSDAGVSTLAEDYWQALIEDNGSSVNAHGASKRER